MKAWNKYLKKQNGALLAVMGVIFLFTLGLLGTGVDLGMAYMQKEKLQNAADAGALAGAGQLWRTDITTSDITQYYISAFVNKNDAGATVDNDNSTNYVDEGITNKINVKATYADPSSTEKTVKVELRRRMPTYFLRIFGFKTLPVEVIAKAKSTKTGGSGTKILPFGDASNINNPFNYVFAAAYHDRTVKSTTIDFAAYNMYVKGNIRTNGQIFSYGNATETANTLEGKIVGGFDKESEIWNTYYNPEGYPILADSSTTDYSNPKSPTYEQAESDMNISNNAGNKNTSLMYDYINSVKKMTVAERNAAHIYYSNSGSFYGHAATITDANGKVINGIAPEGGNDTVVYTTIITLKDIVVSPTRGVFSDTTGTNVMAKFISLNGNIVIAQQNLKDDDPDDNDTHAFKSISYAPKGIITIYGTGKVYGSYVANAIYESTPGQKTIYGDGTSSGGGGSSAASITLIDPDSDS